MDCYDRIVISGNLFPLCCSQGMTSYSFAQRMRVFDYTKFAGPLRDEVGETIAQSGPCRPAIPEHAVHSFRWHVVH